MPLPFKRKSREARKMSRSEELAAIPRRTPEWIVVHEPSDAKGPYRGAVPNRAARRTYARAFRAAMPEPVYMPREVAR